MLAEASGVSTATVSRALAGHPAVLPETRARIVALARDHGYLRNDLMAKLRSHVRTGRTQRFYGNIAVIHVPAAAQPQLLANQRQIITGAKARAQELGFQLYEFSLSQEKIGTKGYVRMLKARGVQGVIFLYTEPTKMLDDFPWEDFSTIENDYGSNEPVLHTVCVDHHLSLTGALRRLETGGYRRIGFFISEFKDSRVGWRWSASFASYQRHSKTIGQVPMHKADKIVAGSFLDWYREHRPDLLIGHVDEAVTWLEKAGVKVPDETAFFNLNWFERTRPCAGLDLRLELQGRVATENLVAQIQRTERGLPQDPRIIMVQARWMDGPTLRPGPAAATA
jgi:LacI family transcriptional regulator